MVARGMNQSLALVGRGLSMGVRNPKLFVSKLQRRLRPMRADYRKRYKMTLAEWLLYHQNNVVFSDCTWMGVRALKNPMDAWIYQEILFEVKPDVLVEIGSKYGGSTLYYANLMDNMGKGTVVSVDIDRSIYKAEHPRIVTITGDSKSPEIVAQVADLCAGKTAMVIQDGDHATAAVLADIRQYERFVTPGSYLIVEDGIQDLYHPGDGLGTSGGPLLATEQFLRENSDFVVDKKRERYLLTYNPRGFLRRTR